MGTSQLPVGIRHNFYWKHTRRVEPKSQWDDQRWTRPYGYRFHLSQRRIMKMSAMFRSYPGIHQILIHDKWKDIHQVFWLYPLNVIYSSDPYPWQMERHSPGILVVPYVYNIHRVFSCCNIMIENRFQLFCRRLNLSVYIGEGELQSMCTHGEMALTWFMNVFHMWMETNHNTYPTDIG